MNQNRPADHLANEPTFFAWLCTGVAVAVFGFAIGRFAVAIQQLTAAEGGPAPTTGLSVWLGTAGDSRRRGHVIWRGSLALAAYLIYVGFHL